jgi:hypothetical protein
LLWAYCNDAVDSDEDLWLVSWCIEHLKWNRFEPKVSSARLDLFSSIDGVLSLDWILVIWSISFDSALWDFTLEAIEILHIDCNLETVLV